MKKRFSALLLACLAFALGAVPAFAANRVDSMDIDLALRPDGSAAVTQVWTASTEEGTEFYLACRDNGYLSVTDFSVADENGPYLLLEDWDLDASLEEKAGKCGVHETDEGVELCWGIGSYGQHQYTLTYILHDVVGAYEDADGFNHRFVDEMTTFPTDVTLTIRSEDGTPLTDECCDVWAFGYDGSVEFSEDGTIRACTGTPLEGREHMTILLSLEKGLLTPRRTAEGSFEAVKEAAFSGSSYDTGSEEEEELTAGDIATAAAALGGTVGVVALAGAAAAKARKKKLRKRMEAAPYFRDAPNGGNMNVTHRLGSICELCREDSLLGAYLLRLISDGSLEPEETGENTPCVDLRLVRAPVSREPFDDAFYTILEAAAGPDGVLQARELERFSNENAKPLTGFVESCRQDADRALIRGGCYKGEGREGIKSLTPNGKKQLDEILGLKRFLLDFSLIHERGVQETVIWQDYLIYAHLLGIADRVAPQIGKLYPDALPQVERFTRCIGYAGYYNRYLYNAYALERQRQQAARSAGSGGRASYSGGGGFSGGGGGGTR